MTAVETKQLVEDLMRRIDVGAEVHHVAVETKRWWEPTAFEETAVGYEELFARRREPATGGATAPGHGERAAAKYPGRDGSDGPLLANLLRR